MLGIDCPVCDNTGYILTVVDGIEYGKKCACMDEYANRMRIRRSGLASVFEEYTFDNYRVMDKWQETIKQTAMDFTRADRDWFYIGGAVGSGKSHICTAICGELIKRQAVYYMPWRDDIVPLKASVTDNVEYQRRINRLKTIAVLYIDDFFKGNITDADTNIAFEVVNSRYNSGLTTIISSEYDIDEIISISEATGSRIYHRANGFCIFIPQGAGKNYRLNHCGKSTKK
jgi:DNA replication protein DnaC